MIRTRHYVERILSERRQSHDQRHADEREAIHREATRVSEAFASHYQAHEQRHEADKEAMKLARESMDLRLKNVTQNYVTQEQFKTFQDNEAARRRTLVWGLVALFGTPIIALIFNAFGGGSG